MGEQTSRAGQDPDDFSVGLGRGMRPAAPRETDRAADEALLARLDEFDAVRNRGAVEARTAWIR